MKRIKNTEFEIEYYKNEDKMKKGRKVTYHFPWSLIFIALYICFTLSG